MKDSVFSDNYQIINYRDLKPYFEKALEARQVFNKLPAENSLIALDLIFMITISHITKEKLTVKSLWSNLAGSNTGIRFQFNKLIDGGWIVTSTHEGDARAKLVSPTPKLLNLLASLLL